MEGHRRGRAPRVLSTCWLAAALVTSALVIGPAPRADAQAADLNAEARVFFEQGNRHFADAMRVRGDRRRALLEQALQSYVSSLRVVRSRNAIFNAAVTLEELGRHDEAFAYLSEYLGIPGLSEVERSEAHKRRDALRDRVAVVAIESEPPGAEVRVDRLDLASRGRTPLQVALPPGAHTVYLTRAGYERATVEVEARRGEKVDARATLTPSPIELRVQAPAGGRLLVDGAPARLGAPIHVAPGRHTLRLERQDAPPIEREVTIEPGSEPLEVSLGPAPGSATLLVAANVPAHVYVDGAMVGRGREVRVPVAPGSHAVRVESTGYAAYEGMVAAQPESTSRVEVSLRPSVGGERDLGRAPLWSGIATGAVGLATVGLIVRAALLKGDYDEFTDTCALTGCTGTDASRAEQMADDVDKANLVADVFIGVTGALAVTTLVLLLANDPIEQDPSTATIAVVPTRGGAVLGASFQLGGM